MKVVLEKSKLSQVVNKMSIAFKAVAGVQMCETLILLPKEKPDAIAGSFGIVE
jgi:hypothetical protein